ncbi:EamA family transporter [Anaerocolumna jejuensis]|uniref:EamA family transporter n=1 Tax=Anaerocolumna jejuensis TaxID=259063 RepID=UPI003F7B6F5A
MDRTTLLYSSILLLGVFISALSQVILKKATQKKYDSVIKEYMNFYVILAYVIFVGTTILSVLAYRGIPLSMGPVLEATSYIYVTIFGVKIFHEKINKKKLLALALIILGIVIYSVLG